MRNRLLAIAAIAGAIAAPIAAQAQSHDHHRCRRGGTVVIGDTKASPPTSGRPSANTSCANACRTTRFRIA
jgi:hypothetical protein